MIILHINTAVLDHTIGMHSSLGTLTYLLELLH